MNRGLATPRPPLRRSDAITTLADFAIVTFDVDPVRLGAMLPPGFEPEVRTLLDGRDRGFVSAVSFRDVDFRVAGFPSARFSFPQTNYRAYISRGGIRAVWFFGTTLASMSVVVPRTAWKLPWHHGRTRLEATWDGERCLAYRLETAARWGAATVDLADAGPLEAGPLEAGPLEAGPVGSERLDGFADLDDALLVLTHPLTGFYYRRDGRVGSYSVWHPPLAPRLGSARAASYSVFESRGLVEPGARPHSVLLQRETEFIIQLPPGIIG